jgi:hypothetical protein
MFNYNYMNESIISQEYCPKGFIAVIDDGDMGAGGVGQEQGTGGVGQEQGSGGVGSGQGARGAVGAGSGQGSGGAVGAGAVGAGGSEAGVSRGIDKDSLALVIITILHIIVILFVLITPFTNYNYFLFMHAIIVPFIMLHWYLNNNTCSLTIAEKEIRKRMNGGNNNVDDDECYTYKFIAPIYDFNKNHEEYSNFIYILTSGLWLITLYKLYRKFSDGSITSFIQLMS